MGMEWIKALASLSGVEKASHEGFSGVQIEVGLLVQLTDSQLHEQKELLERTGLRVAVCNAPLPAEVSVTQKGFNIYVWMEYIKNAVRTVAELGCDKLVWNDGRARLLPLEGDTSGAKQQTLQFLAMLCDAAAPFGIAVLVEPLDPRRTNFLNTVEETAEFIGMVGRSNLSILISLRELAAIGLGADGAAGMQRFAALINHVQLEHPEPQSGARRAPRPDDGYDYLPFLRTLRRNGYDETITLPTDADAELLAYCKTLWEQAG